MDWAREEVKAGSLHSEAVTCARPGATYSTSAQVAADWTAQHLQSVALLMGFPGGSDGKASACNAGDPGSIPGSGRSPGEGNGNPLQHSCLENPMDGAT